MTLFVIVVYCNNHLWLYLNPTAHHLGAADVQRMIRSPVKLRNWKLCSKNDQKSQSCPSCQLLSVKTVLVSFHPLGLLSVLLPVC